jgi:hypothetical protein
VAKITELHHNSGGNMKVETSSLTDLQAGGSVSARKSPKGSISIVKLVKACTWALVMVVALIARQRFYDLLAWLKGKPNRYWDQ